jgi:hypothetical protein
MRQLHILIKNLVLEMGSSYVAQDGLETLGSSDPTDWTWE